MPSLNPRYRAFAAAFVSGPPGVRGNGTAAYKLAGFSPRTDAAAGAAAARLLATVSVQQEVARLHAVAEATTIRQLQDWKGLAPDAQRRIQLVAMGYLSDPETPGGRRLIRSRDDVAVARVLLEANLAIVERAYPAKLSLDILLRDPDLVLATLLGVPVSELPAPAPPETGPEVN